MCYNKCVPRGAAARIYEGERVCSGKEARVLLRRRTRPAAPPFENGSKHTFVKHITEK